MTTVLFDIDGTLLDTEGQGGQAFLDSVRQIWPGVGDLSWVTFSGATDLNLLHQITHRLGVSLQPEESAAFFADYNQRLRQTLDPAKVRVLPHVRSTLEELVANDAVRLGLVTGNARASAFTKLKAGGLASFFSEGGFGDEDPVRARLVRLAMDRLQSGGTAVLVGDTPSDILAAVEQGIRAVGVATGGYTQEALQLVHAEAHVLPSLETFPSTVEF